MLAVSGKFQSQRAVFCSAGQGLASWVALDGTGGQKPNWDLPTDSDHACARKLAAQVAAAAAAEVQQLVADGLIDSAASSPRHKLYRALR
jgi:hypothetical protein